MLRALSRLGTPGWRLHLVGGGSGGAQSGCLRLAAELSVRVKAHAIAVQPMNYHILYLMII